MGLNEYYSHGLRIGLDPVALILHLRYPGYA